MMSLSRPDPRNPCFAPLFWPDRLRTGLLPEIYIRRMGISFTTQEHTRPAALCAIFVHLRYPELNVSHWGIRHDPHQNP
jgi:hypothetical protein